VSDLISRDSNGMEQLETLTAQLVERDAIIKQNNALMRTILEASPVGICLVEDRVIQWSNCSLAHTFGYEPHDMVNLPMSSLYPNNQEYERIGNAVYRDKCGGFKVGEIKAKMVRKNGDAFDALIRVSFVEDSPETMVVAVIVDLRDLLNLCTDYLAENGHPIPV